MTRITRNQLKTELPYWLHSHWLENSENPEEDINEIAKVFCNWHEQHNGPIGDFTLKALRENRAHEKYSTKDARFEILPFLVPLLDGTPPHALNGRFSPEIFDTILTQNERHNLKEHVWQQLSQPEKDLLRARVLTDQPLMLATNHEFLDVRKKFWEIDSGCTENNTRTRINPEQPSNQRR